jgi:peptide/nickel transport system permease protein
MIHEMVASAPWTYLFPGLAIVTTVLSVNLVGEALRDAVDPRNA